MKFGDPLSMRELDVLRLVALGYTNARAGNVLFLTGHTVKSHLNRIQVKLGTRDRAHSTATAVALGLLAVEYGPDGVEVRIPGRRLPARREAVAGPVGVAAGGVSRLVPAGTSR